MWRRWFAVLVVCAGAIGCILALELASLQAPPRNAEHRKQTHSEDRTSEPENQGDETFWQRTVNDPTAFFTLWVAAFTAVLAASTIGLLVATYRQARLAREEFVATHRPRLRVQQAVLSGYLEDGKEPTADVRVLNIGDTNATVSAIGVAIFTRPTGLLATKRWDAVPKDLPESRIARPGQEVVLESKVESC